MGVFIEPLRQWLWQWDERLPVLIHAGFPHCSSSSAADIHTNETNHDSCRFRDHHRRPEGTNSEAYACLQPIVKHAQIVLERNARVHFEMVNSEIHFAIFPHCTFLPSA